MYYFDVYKELGKKDMTNLMLETYFTPDTCKIKESNDGWKCALHRTKYLPAPPFFLSMSSLMHLYNNDPEATTGADFKSMDDGLWMRRRWKSRQRGRKHISFL